MPATIGWAQILSVGDQYQFAVHQLGLLQGLVVNVVSELLAL